VETKEKTIFITITRGFIVRNILRSGVLGRLKEAGFRVVVFFDVNGTKMIPEYLKKELEDEQVILKIAPSTHIKGHSRFAKLTPLLISSKSRWMYSQFMPDKRRERAFFWKYVDLAIFSISSRIGFLKTFSRFIEKSVFSHNVYAPYFEKHKPVLIFSTSIQAHLDIDMMKESQKRNIPTVSMPKGWDNVTQILYRVVPDVLIVQDEQMKKEAIRVQAIPSTQIEVTGFPQFDWYRKPNVLVSREEYCHSVGLDPNKKIIFYGSEGAWAPDDANIVSTLVRWVNIPGALSCPSQLFIRPHYTDAKTNRLAVFGREPNVVVDKNFTLSDFFGDNWDPGVEEIKKFTNLIYHCDLLVTVASTLNLDCVCFDKPLINVAFGVLHHPRSGKDVSPLLYTQDHIEWVLETDAVDLIHNKDDLKESINTALLNPDSKRKEREQLLKKLCYKVDGNSSDRIANTLIRVANQG